MTAVAVGIDRQTLLAAGAGATDLYRGFAAGNPDLSSSVQSIEAVGIQPGVGDSVYRYHGSADGNPDLFKVVRSGPTDSGQDPDLYTSVWGNPDLHFRPIGQIGDESLR